MGVVWSSTFGSSCGVVCPIDKEEIQWTGSLRSSDPHRAIYPNT